MAQANEIPLGLYVALESTGLVELSFDPSKSVQKSLSVVSVCKDAGHMPNWVVARGDEVYSINRTAYPDGRSSSGGVHSFRHDDTGFHAICKASSHGKGGCHISVSPDGKALVATNITGSTVTVYPLSDDGAIGEPTYVFDYNKTDPGPLAAHPHQTSFDARGRLMLSALRTMDCVDIYAYRSPQDIVKIARITLPPLSGPRHFAIRSVTLSRALLYVLSEKENSIRVYRLNMTDAGPVTVNLMQAIGTLDKNCQLTAPDMNDLAAEIAISDDGRFLYASNRGFQSLANDTMTVFAIDDTSVEHHLVYVDTQRTYGKHPRNFALSRDSANQWVAVANQFSQDLVVFERDVQTGRLGSVRGKMDLRVKGTDEITFVNRLSLEGVVTIRDCLKGRLEGPMCVQWKK
ncbi:hypothetical protein SBRCBS47491_009946 [Sporothrix bragantina]|uniref:3-carboxymuconate cyclase n=1 Tax=Sporothrix bragantina TaxID=671064 RepID=A0ABP0CYY3_9PEZI